MMTAAALAVVAAGCAGSSSAPRETSARYVDPAGDGGALPDIREIDVKSGRDGRIAIRVKLVPPPPDSCAGYVNVFIDADANPDTGNDLDAAGLEYVPRDRDTRGQPVAVAGRRRLVAAGERAKRACRRRRGGRHVLDQPQRSWQHGRLQLLRRPRRRGVGLPGSSTGDGDVPLLARPRRLVA
jgi:hypothetical protein